MKKMTVAQFAELSKVSKEEAASFINICVRHGAIRRVGEVRRPHRRGRRAALYAIPKRAQLNFTKNTKLPLAHFLTLK